MVPNLNLEDEHFMGIALERAREAADRGEVPVGAVVVCAGEVISLGQNIREGEKTPLGHAELEAIQEACQKLGGWRLHTCTLYVTLEPCPMCAGAIINARLQRVVFGAYDPKAGCFGSVCDLSAMPFNHHPQVVGGVRAQECGQLLKEFFQSLRRAKQKWDTL